MIRQPGRREEGYERARTHTRPRAPALTNSHTCTKQKTKKLAASRGIGTSLLFCGRPSARDADAKPGALSRHDAWEHERSQVATGLMSLYHRKRLTPFMGSARHCSSVMSRWAASAESFAPKKKNMINGVEKKRFFSFLSLNSEEEEVEADKRGVREAQRGCL